MKIRHLILFIGFVVLAIGSGCRTEFERIRTSGDAEVMLEKAHAYYDSEDYTRAQTLYELVISSYRGREEAELLAFRYAYSFYHLRQFITSSYYFKNFAETFGASQYREEAEFMSAYSNYELSPNYRLDQTYSLQAIEGFQEFINLYPNSERVGQCNRLIDEIRLKLEQKDYESSRLYYDLQQYQACIRSFENVLIEYPETSRAEEVRYRIIDAAFRLAENSFVERQEERYLDVVQRAQEFVARYTESEYRSEVQDMINDSQKRLNQLQDVRYQE